jgi:hypothetical protein
MATAGEINIICDHLFLTRFLFEQPLCAKLRNFQNS